jgi:DNA replication protein DnaC
MADDNSFRKLIEDFQVADLDFVNHNETDYDSFREYSRVLDERYEAARRAKEIEAKKKNLVKWVEQIPERWRRASFRTFDADSIDSHQSAVDAAKRMLRAKQRGFYISGPHTSGKSYLAYAIIREFVAHGKLKPSQIRVITEGDLIALANGGYETREALDRLFDPHYKCYLFDSLGTRSQYDEKREAPALTKLIEEAYNRSALFISTSHMDLELYESGLSEQSAAKLRHMVKDGIIYTGQPLYGKNDPRRSQTLDVDFYNATGEHRFDGEDEPDEAPAPRGSKSSSASWKDNTPKVRK